MEEVLIEKEKEESSSLFWMLTSAFLGVVCISESIKNQKKDVQIRELQEDRLKLLKESLRNSKNFSIEVKQQINKLVSSYQNSNPEVSIEMTKVLKLVEIGEDVKAIKDLAKILENLLKEKYQQDSAFLTKKRNPSLKNLIDHALQVKFLSQRLYNTACILYDFRNAESHELAVDDSDNMKMIGLIGGLEIVLKIND